ncbi:hypothetical protein BEI_1239 [Halomonas beimenensis]|uniref:Uncharacterized protein n=1 Tax=Halomonas beimenensis TaxID=475662 RepID=A0A291P5R1_9GAMM|nr:hypothetical protein BEI_1239 [Halomonas beimenensis]
MLRACAQRMARMRNCARPCRGPMMQAARHGMFMLSTGRRQDMSRRVFAHPALRSPPTPGIHRFANAGLRHDVVRIP